ncbi:unnamed protein product [Lymnaea stagnalis]|uniref:Dynein axonemal assembly factor 4 n=1 Tax=Lymnaea stagnalis TaxID=6523 RepID=A0AAV2I2M9_LYMST
MPLLIKDYTWEETDQIVWITVPLKGVKANNVSIFTSDEYLKVSYPPYLFECLLVAPVEDTRGCAQVGNGAVVFKLFKKEPRFWNCLQSSDTDDKEIMRQRRDEAHKKVQRQIEEEVTKRSEIKREHEKLAVSEMMKIEQDERGRISNIKENERLKATQDLERWKEEQRLVSQQEIEKMRAIQKVLIGAEKEKDREERKRQRRVRTSNIFEKETKDNKVPPRENGKIVINHTPRVFPTPTRESQAQQEEEWLKKQAEARRTIQNSLDNDLNEEEKNPQWLQDKGNSFFAAGDFKSAINAYTHAIHLAPKIHSLYSNRAACHLKLKNLFKCIEDCSKALDLLFPPVTQNAGSRCKALIRRGTAFCLLEMYVEGLRDYDAALAIDQNVAIAKDAERIRKVIQSSDPS